MLDLFCGEGLAAWGYWLSGRFTEIVGVDIDSEMRRSYSFDFVSADALKLTYETLLDFDFIHASPPCQAYSHMTPNPALHPRLIAGTRHMLHASGKPHVIENVEGSSTELRPNLVLDGHYVGLPMERRRYFYVSTLNACRRLILPGETTIRVHGGDYMSRDRLINVFGLEDINEQRLRALSRRGILQGIPPRMTRWIAQQVFPQRTLIG